MSTQKIMLCIYWLDHGLCRDYD